MTLLNRWLSGSPAYDDYQAFVRRIVEPLYTRLGVDVVENEPKLDIYGRSLAINLACQAGLQSCLDQTAEQLQRQVAAEAQIAPDLQSAIYCNGLRQGNSSTFLHLLDKMFESEDQAERTLIIAALGCSQDETLLTQLLNLVLISEDSLRLQEKFRVLAAPANNGELGLRVMMNFIRNNFHAITAVSASQVGVMLNNIAQRISSTEVLQAFNGLLTFLEDLEGISETNKNSYILTATSNLQWQDKHLDEIAEWLRQANIPETTTQGAGSLIVSTVVITLSAVLKYFL